MNFGQTNPILDITVFILALLLDLLWIRWRKKHHNFPLLKKGIRLFSIIQTWINKSLLGLFKHFKIAREKTRLTLKLILKQNSTKLNQKVHFMRENLRNRFSTWWMSSHQIFVSKNSTDPLVSDLKRWQAIIEIGVIVFIVWTYCWGFLDLGQHTVLPGNESETFQILDTIFTNTLRQSGHFLAWNPNLFSGLPLIGDPMFHFFNPLVGLPILLFGVANGYKIALFLSFVAGALGMWFLALIFGMKRVSRIWMALLFTFAGQPTARFFQGQYLFVFAWAFIPWTIAGLYGVYRTRRRIYAAITALALG